MGWGATQEDWLHMDLVLGLGADLLPVVSNPHAVISPDSKMKGLGKTPSIYNAARNVAGIPEWTEKQATARELERWAKEEDYGICIQTRSTRGLDIDVPDVRVAARIAKAFELAAGGGEPLGLPKRSRAGTGKALLGFTIPGDIGKRSFKVEGGLVEFLATGQQFIAIGTHPSGTRYEWAGGLPDEFPAISLEQFERAWAAIVAEFAVEPERRAAGRRGGGLGNSDGGVAIDPVADFLDTNWPTYGTQGGKLFVECPWKSGHSGDSGETEAAWLLAGTGGYEQGHYECLHASCNGRRDDEFLDAVGYRLADFDELPEAVAPKRQGQLFLEGRGDLPLPGFKRDKQGDIEPVIENVVAGVAVPQLSGFDARFDTFRAETMVAERPDEWRPYHDSDGVRMRINLASGRFKPVGKEMMRDAVMAVAWDRQFDTARIWLEELVPAWDGVPRIERSLSTYFRADDTPYTRACGEYLWTALASRVLDPGCQADMALVFVSPEQGMRKSSGVAALSPSRDFFGEVNLEVRDNDLSRKLRGKLVVELAELRGLKTRDSESIKAWVTQRYEEWTPKYMEANTKFPRRCVLIGTTNDDEFLGDPTGERRWLPMRVKGQAYTDLLERDRLQLWAEGRERWRADGQLWETAERLAKVEHGAFKERDSWEERIGKWLAEPDLAGDTPTSKGYVRGGEVLTGALGFDPKHVKKSEEMRVARALVALGFVRGDHWVDGKNQKAWSNAQ